MGRHRHLLAAACLPLAACQHHPAQLAAPQAVADSPDLYVQPDSGMRFPSVAGSFNRVEITQFNPDGSDVGVGYAQASSRSQVTLYVYPTPRLTPSGSSPAVMAEARARLCADEFSRHSQALVHAHPGARLLSEGAARPPAGWSGIAGQRAAFALTGMPGHEQETVQSELLVYCYVGGRWTVEYRITTPRDIKADTVIADFMAAVPWTLPGR